MKDSDSYGLGLREGKIPLLATMRREESRCSCGFFPLFVYRHVKRNQTEALYR